MELSNKNQSVLNRRKFLKTSSLAGIAFGLTGATNVFSVNETSPLSPLLIDSEGRSIKSLKNWKVQQKIIKKEWQNYLGIVKVNRAKPQIRVLHKDYPNGLIRQFIEYEGEPGLKDYGYLLRPEKIEAPLPGVVAMHSTGPEKMFHIAGVAENEDEEIDDFGFKLAQQGFVVFCPVCFVSTISTELSPVPFPWGNRNELTGEQRVRLFKNRHPKSKGMAKMLFDGQRAVDVLISLKEVDSNKIGAMGHSLGAKEVLYLGAFDDRAKVIVSNEGGIGINFSNWDAPWYLGEEINEFGHQHHEVLSLNAPKPFLLIGGDSADGEKSRPYVEAVSPIYELYGKPAGTIQLYNHGTGHNVHPEAEKRTYEWFKKYL